MEFITECLRYTIEIESSRKNLHLVDKLLMKVNQDFKLDEYRFNNLLTAVTEVVLNAIVHGNKENKNKKVKIDIDFDDNALTAKIQDEGEGLNNYVATHPSLPEDPLSISGRGLFIVKALVNNIDCYKTIGGFCCIITVNK